MQYHLSNKLNKGGVTYIGLFHLISVPPSRGSLEFFRALVKLTWNSSGYYEVHVEFFRDMPIIVMEFFRDKGFEILQAKAKVF